MPQSRQVILMILAVLLLSTPLQSTPTAQDPLFYQPTDATLTDNMYNTTPRHTLQWWYFDATLEDNYTIHLGLCTIGANKINGFVLFQINLYHHALPTANQFKLTSLRALSIPADEPVILLQGQELMKTYLDKDNHYCVSLNLTIHDLGVNLLFRNTTKGWMGYTGRGWWGAPLPNADVTGTLTINGQTLPVNGTGYQEHGWGVRRLPKSWYWGKCRTPTMNLVFSHIMKNHYQEEMQIAMFNTPEDTYLSIHPSNITFTHQNYIWSHGRLIPQQSSLTIQHAPVSANLTLTVTTIHYRYVLFIQYWRFHVHITGYLRYNDTQEEVNEITIMEVLYRLI